MKKEMIIFGLIVFCLCSFIMFNMNKSEFTSGKLEAVILYKDDNQKMVIEDNKHVLYIIDDINEDLGTKIALEYSSINNNIIDKVISYEVINEVNNNLLPDYLNDNGIFSDYYFLAYNKLKKMSINEKISELLLVKYQDNIDSIINKYPFGGLVFDKDFFANKVKEDVINKMVSLNSKSIIPLLFGVNEEGGEYVPVSHNKNLSNSPFLSASALYKEGGFPLIKDDTIKKSDMLYKLGINLNFAPVVDISDKDTFMYERTLKEDVNKTSDYAKTVINASKNTGVSYVLKHFPGYSNNIDTGTWISIDNRTLEEVNEDIKPFNEGIKNGAEAVLVSNAIVKVIDSNNPASLSLNIHNMLRDDLKFTGVIIMDSRDEALSNISRKYLKALVNGNDLIITDNYDDAINEIGNALINNSISEELINYHVFRILAFKYYKGMMIEEK